MCSSDLDIYNALSKSYKIETYYDIIKKYKDTQFDKHLKQFCQNNNQYKDVYKWQFDKVKTEDLYNSIVDSSQITLIKSKITETEENETMINTLLNEFNKEYNEIYSEINNYEKNIGKLLLRQLLAKHKADFLVNEEKLGFNVNTLNLWKYHGHRICKSFLSDSRMVDDDEAFPTPTKTAAAPSIPKQESTPWNDDDDEDLSFFKNLASN